MTNTWPMSVRLGMGFLAEQVHEPVEEVVRVVRTGRRFRVVLDGEGRYLQGPQPFDDVVVEAYVADLDRSERGLGDPVRRCIDGEAVVVRRHLDLAGDPVEHRLVGTTVTVG